MSCFLPQEQHESLKSWLLFYFTNWVC